MQYCLDIIIRNQYDDRVILCNCGFQLHCIQPERCVAGYNHFKPAWPFQYSCCLEDPAPTVFSYRQRMLQFILPCGCLAPVPAAGIDSYGPFPIEVFIQQRRTLIQVCYGIASIRQDAVIFP